MGQIPSSIRDSIVDVVGSNPAIMNYTFFRASASDATLTGYFVGVHGEQEGAAVSYTITNAAATLTSLYNAANSILPATTPLPGSLHGFIGTTNQPIYVGLSGQRDGTASNAPAAGYPIIPASPNMLAFGRVPFAFLATSEAATGVVPTISTKPTGAPNNTITQVTATNAAGTLVGVRLTRLGVTFKNNDTAVTAYYGPAGVTTATGFALKPGESITKTWTGLTQVITAAGTAVIMVDDEYY